MKDNNHTNTSAMVSPTKMLWINHSSSSSCSSSSSSSSSSSFSCLPSNTKFCVLCSPSIRVRAFTMPTITSVKSCSWRGGGGRGEVRKRREEEEGYIKFAVVIHVKVIEESHIAQPIVFIDMITIEEESEKRKRKRRRGRRRRRRRRRRRGGGGAITYAWANAKMRFANTLAASRIVNASPTLDNARCNSLRPAAEERRREEEERGGEEEEELIEFNKISITHHHKRKHQFWDVQFQFD